MKAPFFGKKNVTIYAQSLGRAQRVANAAGLSRQNSYTESTCLKRFKMAIRATVTASKRKRLKNAAKCIGLKHRSPKTWIVPMALAACRYVHFYNGAE